jgi:hypothetical protein
MARSSDRPYGRSSISELEAAFRQAKADPEILRRLDHELGYRASKRASKLRSLVVEARTGRLNSGSVEPSTGGGEGPRTTGSAGVISLPNATERLAPRPAPTPAVNSENFASSADLSAVQDFEPPPVSPAPRAETNQRPSSQRGPLWRPSPRRHIADRRIWPAAIVVALLACQMGRSLGK